MLSHLKRDPNKAFFLWSAALLLEEKPISLRTWIVSHPYRDVRKAWNALCIAATSCESENGKHLIDNLLCWLRMEMMLWMHGVK